MPAGLTHVFHFLGIFASGSLRGVLGSKTAIALKDRVICAANFVEERRGRCSFRLGLHARFISANFGSLIGQSAPARYDKMAALSYLKQSPVFFTKRIIDKNFEAHVSIQ